MNPPFEPFMGNHLYHIVTYWRLLAGIRFQSPQKHGIHSLVCRAPLTMLVSRR
jgi:hypothetical protein